MKRRRRCVRIEAVDQDGKVLDGFQRIDGGRLWTRITHPEWGKNLTRIWCLELKLRNAGYTHIRKVYDPIEEAK